MIQMYKLSNGDDIIAIGTFDNNSRRHGLKKAVKVIYTPTGIGMIPYSSFFKDEVLSLSENHVVIHGEVADDLKNAYNKQFNTGIIEVKTSGIKLVGD